MRVLYREMHKSQSRSFKHSLVITLPKMGIGWLLVTCTLLRIPITPRPVTWKFAFSEHSKALNLLGILSMQMHHKPLALGPV
jgi:hypothetical protein